MACLDMYNSEHKGIHSSYAAPMSPRISFSNDFVESHHGHQIVKQERNSTPVSSDFEFSVSNYSMMSADELFFKGKLLPFRDTCNNQMQRTLREELLVEEEEDDMFQIRPPKGSQKWKGFLSLKKSHIGSKKVEKTEGSAEKTHDIKTNRELLNEGGSSGRDVESGI
ncbi:hypothetical protein SLE2022_302020 [Rubroshorea leprosula]